jgi:hypothetical protein
MARYEITGPDGAKYEVNAPDGASEQDAITFLQQQIGQQQPPADRMSFAKKNTPGLSLPEVDPVADTVKSAGSGLARGAIGMVGLPGTVEQLGRAGINYGAKQLGASGDVVSPETALPTGQDLQKRVEGVTGKFYEPKTMPGRYAGAIGEFAPGALFPGGVAQRVLGNVVGPAVASETAGELTKGTAYEPWARVGGALVGGALPNVAARGLTPAPSSATRQNAVQTLRNEGVTDLTAGQITGANPLRWTEAAILDTPLTGARLPNKLERQAEQFTGAALKRAGITGTRATPDVIDQGFQQLGTRFDELANASQATITVSDAKRITGALREYEKLTPPASQVPYIREIVNDIGGIAGMPISGEVYQRYRSVIERVARGTQAPEVASALREIRNVLDDAVERGLQPQMQGQWREARTQYRNLLTVSRAAGAAGENAANGLISPAQLSAAAKATQGRRNFERGRGELANLGRAGEAVMKQMPQSGTAPRMMAMQVGQTVAGGAAGAMAGGGDPTATGLGAVLPWLVRGAAGRAIMSPAAQRYLANQAVPGGVNARQGGLSSLFPSIASANNQGAPLELTVYPPGDPRNNR